MSDLDDLRRTLPMVGAEPSILDDTNIAHVVAHGHHILSRRTVPVSASRWRKHRPPSSEN